MPLAQAVVEHGLLSAMATGISTFFEQLHYYVEAGRSNWIIVVIVVVVAWVFLRPKR
jgi:hypothetical protein